MINIFSMCCLSFHILNNALSLALRIFVCIFIKTKNLETLHNILTFLNSCVGVLNLKIYSLKKKPIFILKCTQLSSVNFQNKSSLCGTLVDSFRIVLIKVNVLVLGQLIEVN